MDAIGALPLPLERLRRQWNAWRARASRTPDAAHRHPRADRGVHLLDARMRRDIGLVEEVAWRAAERHLWLP